ncbi:MAG: carbon storage regulator [Thermoguttaceae bacterium]
MLVLSRKSGASIRIGADIVISVLSIQGSRVRLGISAPADTDIWRAELIDGREALPAGRCRCMPDAHPVAGF